MDMLIIVIVAILVAILSISFLSKVLKTFFKIALIFVLAVIIFALLAGFLDLKPSTDGDNNTTNSTLENVTIEIGDNNTTTVSQDITAKVTGFVARSIGKATMSANEVSFDASKIKTLNL